MTPRQRVEAALAGQPPDRVPFTVYESKLPQCAVERELRNDGLCIMNRHSSGYSTSTPNCPSETLTYLDAKTGKSLVRTTTHTPKGDLVAVHEPAGFTSWRVELPFRGPDDYERLIAQAKDTQYEPAYENVVKIREWMGEDVYLRGGLGYSPLQAIIYNLLGVEQFCFEWVERREEVLRLYEALWEKDRRLYEIAAASPHQIVQYCGNVSPEIVGRERFEQYILPCYNEFAEVLHRHGKQLLVHLDANCKLLGELIASSGIDIIEAFTPAPDTDLTMAEARALWPDKVLWINFPSSVHLSSDEVIYRTACELIEANGGDPRFLIGITEDVPENRWQGSFRAIMSATIDAVGGNAG